MSSDIVFSFEVLTTVGCRLAGSLCLVKLGPETNTRAPADVGNLCNVDGAAHAGTYVSGPCVWQVR